MDSISSAEWELHQKYGVIHSWPCVVCKNYISHLGSFYAQPKVSPIPLYEMYYHDGVRDGMKVGKFQANNSLKAVQAEKEAALDHLAAAQRKCLELEERLTETPRQSEQEKALRQKTRPLTATSAPHLPQSSSGGRRPITSYSPQSTPSPVSLLPPYRSIKLATQFPIRGAHSDPASQPPSFHSPADRRGIQPSTSGDVSQTALPPTLHISDGPKTNPRIEDPVEVWYDYYCTHRKSWPRGVQSDSRHRPILSNLRADRAIARLRPSSVTKSRMLLLDAQDTPSPRNQFKNFVVVLFSQHGLYGERVKEMEWDIASKITYNPYTGPFPIFLDDVVHHFAQSGITREMAEEDFEAWAQNYEAGVNCSIPFTPDSSQQTRTRRRR